MKYIGLFFSLIFTFSIANAQADFDPKIIFLLPETIDIAENCKSSITDIENNNIHLIRDSIKVNYDNLKSNIEKNDSIKPNEQAHQLSLLDFGENLDFVNYMIQSYATKFQKELSSSFPNILTTIFYNKSLEEFRFLKSLTIMKGADYIVFFKSFEVEKRGNGLYVKPVFKLYSTLEEQIIPVSELITNLTFTDSLNTKSKSYPIVFDNDYLSQMQQLIVQNGNATERKIIKDRRRYLDDIFVNNKTNDTIKAALAFSGLELNVGAYHSAMYNSATNQILAFLIEDSKRLVGGIEKPAYKISLVYLAKKSKNWKSKVILENAISAANLSHEERLKGLFYHFINYGFFKENTFIENEDFWKKKMFMKYHVNF